MAWSGPAPFAEHGNAVLFGQAQIQDDGIIRLGVAQKPSFFAVEGAVDGIAGLRKRRNDLTIEVFVVLDDEQPHVLFPVSKTMFQAKRRRSAVQIRSSR